MIDGYAKHAVVWDWDGFDNTQEYDYWCKYAKKFGAKVLIPMCALGQAGAYMAQHGLNVTAFDITQEMIAEGKKRFGSIENLSFHVANICDFELDDKQFDFAFLATQDLHLLENIEMVTKAFKSIAAHLRKGACLALELVLPSAESYASPLRVFHPRVVNYTDKKVWKEGKSNYDAATRKHCIDQTVYIEAENGVDSFDYSVVLQYFERGDILSALDESGFDVTGEYSDRDREPLTSKSGDWIIEAIKK